MKMMKMYLCANPFIFYKENEIREKYEKTKNHGTRFKDEENLEKKIK